MSGWVTLVTLAALLFYFQTGLGVARQRSKHEIKAPAMTGHAELERAVRVQMNTLEWLPIFLVSLWLCALALPRWDWIAALVGVVWIVGRYIYQQAYMADPSTRSQGFLIQFIAVAILFVGALVGTVLRLAGL
jgi:glutathione S-transferase